MFLSEDQMEGIPKRLKDSYKQKAIKGLFENQKFPISDEIHKTILSLPISYMNTKKEIEKDCDVVNKFI